MQSKATIRSVTGTAGVGRAVSRRQAFTLIELILVMTLLLVVLGVSAPSLARFFRGRTLDAEARRIVALTRYGQARAVAEGIPMILWMNPEQGRYGLLAEPYVYDIDSNAVELVVSEGVTLDVEPLAGVRLLEPTTQPLLTREGVRLGDNLPRIRFKPDGGIEDTSPDLLVFRHRDEDEVWVGPSRNRLRYEVLTNRLAALQTRQILLQR